MFLIELFLSCCVLQTLVEHAISSSLERLFTQDSGTKNANHSSALRYSVDVGNDNDTEDNATLAMIGHSRDQPYAYELVRAEFKRFCTFHTMVI